MDLTVIYTIFYLNTQQNLKCSLKQTKKIGIFLNKTNPKVSEKLK